VVTTLAWAFVAGAALSWLSVYGYLLALAALRRRRPEPAPGGALPPITVLMATLNEAARIDAKLADLARTDYPADKLRIVIVDRSSDDTVARIEAARTAGAQLQVLRAPQARSKLDQLRIGFEAIDDELVVTTDADAQLDPGCIRAVVELLVADPTTAVAGARIRPSTGLLDERIYWWFLNTLWWLEGEALSAGVVSGVCYAVRRRVALATPSVTGADDVLFALAAGSQGYGVRLSRRAWADENRVPQTAAEFLRFRSKRGSGYVGALLAPLPAAGLSGWRLARAVRLFHFVVSPVLFALLAIAAVALAAGGWWPLLLAVGTAFVAPAVVALFGSRTLADRPRLQLLAAAGRLGALIWAALLLTLQARRRSRPQPAGALSSADGPRDDRPDAAKAPQSSGSDC
jgi:cellulose synthase/poly-beta-1,6-N-acetylglucosamine synthase-like glycosyltransferase